MKNRFLFADNTALTDMTVGLNDFNSTENAMAVIAANNSLFVGSLCPFNSIHFELGVTANASACELQVLYFDGSAFNQVVEVIDETALAGATMAKSGLVTFTPDKNHSWGYQDTEYIAELSTKKIYDLYWTQFKFTQNVNFSLKWVGNVFADDTALGEELPDLIRPVVMQNFQTSKTSWKAQHIRAAELLINELKMRKMVWDIGQVLTIDSLKHAAIYKVAEMIYGSLGDDYVDDRKAAREEWQDRLNKAFPIVDLNNTARVQRNDMPIQNTYSRLVRQ